MYSTVMVVEISGEAGKNATVLGRELAKGRWQ